MKPFFTTCCFIEQVPLLLELFMKFNGVCFTLRSHVSFSCCLFAVIWCIGKRIIKIMNSNTCLWMCYSWAWYVCAWGCLWKSRLGGTTSFDLTRLWIPGHTPRAMKKWRTKHLWRSWDGRPWNHSWKPPRIYQPSYRSRVPSFSVISKIQRVLISQVSLS